MRLSRVTPKDENALLDPMKDERSQRKTVERKRARLWPAEQG
jgi:hypothetical protein